MRLPKPFFYVDSYLIWALVLVTGFLGIMGWIAYKDVDQSTQCKAKGGDMVVKGLCLKTEVVR